MFNNIVTEKMPCWGCNWIKNCPIQTELLNVSSYVSIRIEGLTFKCLSKSTEKPKWD